MKETWKIGMNDTPKIEKRGSFPLQRWVMCEISDLKMYSFKREIPFFWHIRSILSEAGFKFEDDGKPSAIVNKNPVPLGVMVSWYDEAERTTHYKQTMDT